MAKAKKRSQSETAKGKGSFARAEDVPATQAVLYMVRDVSLHSAGKSIWCEMATQDSDVKGAFRCLALAMERQIAKTDAIIGLMKLLFKRQQRLEGRVAEIEKGLFGDVVPSYNRWNPRLKL